MKLGILDQSPVRKGGTPAQAIAETLQLAVAAERLGYHRYWVAEHHNSSGLAGTAPEILVGQIAGRTSRLRVGSGGVMLSHYAPLKVAEQFRVLEALFPGRIDLGIGRAPGSDARTAAVLAGGAARRGVEDFPDQLLDLYGFLTGDFPEEHPLKDILAMPAGESQPQLWLLGSSGISAFHAADLGWSFCFAHFINPVGGVEMVRRYRDRFEPSPFRPSPYVALAVSATCAETDSEAERLSWSRWVWRLSAQQGRRGGIPSPEDAMATPLTAPEREYIDYARSTSIHGSPRRVRQRLEALAAEYEADELMIVTITHDFAARLRSYELIAEAFDLSR